MRYVDSPAGKLSPTLASSITATLYITWGSSSRDVCTCVSVCMYGAHDSRVYRRPDPRESYTVPVTRACTYVLHAFWRARAIGIPRGPSGVLASGSKRCWEEILPINNGKVDEQCVRERRPTADRRALIRRVLIVAR